MQLDPVSASGEGYAVGPRVLVTVLALVGVALSVGAGLLAARRPSRVAVVFAGVASLLTLPLALGASVLEVAPHAFEVPTHVCPFCLLKIDVLGIGYPLFGAIFVGASWAGGAAVSALLARTRSTTEALARFAPSQLRISASAWGVALAVALVPIVRYALVGGGASLFAAH